MRIKESDYQKKIALYEQKLELLEVQLKEAEERELNQKKMYDRMFQAIEESSGNQSKRQEELFNASHSSISKELENMNKQY